MIGAIFDHGASGTGSSRTIALSFNEPAATAPLWLPPPHIDSRWRGALTSAPRRKSIRCGTAATLLGYQGYTIPRRDTCLHDRCIACPASDAAARMTWRNHRLQPSSKAALLERVAQNCSNLAIQEVETAAKLYLFVRHDALDGDFNDDRQHVTDECCGQYRRYQRSKVGKHVPDKKTRNTAAIQTTTLKNVFISNAPGEAQTPSTSNRPASKAGAMDGTWNNLPSSAGFPCAEARFAELFSCRAE